MKTLQQLLMKKKISIIKRKDKNHEDSKKWYWKINLIQKGKKEVGNDKFISCN